MIHVTIWNEYLHEVHDEKVKAIYPHGIHGCIQQFLEKDPEIKVTCVTLDMEEHGLTKALLEKTDVLIWWGHWNHEGVEDDIVLRVKEHVLKGMGLIALHSAHHSKIMKSLLGTSLNLRWHHDDSEKLICIAPGHPIAEGVPDKIYLEQEEMYGEYFDIPKPDEVVFLGWFSSGEVFRSGCTFTRGNGKIFYFQPGHEEYPIYHDKEIQKIIANSIYWAKPVNRRKEEYPCTKATWEVDMAGDDKK